MELELTSNEIDIMLLTYGAIAVHGYGLQAMIII